MVQKIKNIVLSFAGKMPDKVMRGRIAQLLSETVFSGMMVIDIATPEEVANLQLVYAIDLPDGLQKILVIDTANGMLNPDNIKILLA